MERRRMRRKSGFGKRMMVTMLSLIMLLGVFNPGLLASAEETNFMDSFINAYDQQTQSGSETMGSLALSYIAKYDVLKAKGQALDTAAQDYAAQVEALNAEMAALDAAVVADAAAGLLTEAEVTSIRAAVAGSVSGAGSAAPAGDASLKKQTVTCFEDNKTFAVTGNLPEGTTLSVTKLESEVNDYIHNHILGLDALPAGYTGEAFDIKLLDKDGNAFQPADQVNVGVTADGITENSDVTVYHLPGTSADDVYAGYNKDVNGISLMRTVKELVGEKIETVNAYEGYYAFLTDGFSTYYVVAGHSDEISLSDTSIVKFPSDGENTYYIERGASIEFKSTGLFGLDPGGWDRVTSAEGITRERNTFSVSLNAPIGATAVYRYDESKTFTFIVTERKEIIEEAIRTQPVYLAIRLEQSLPGEPGVTDGDYKRLNSNYTANGWTQWEEYTFAKTASGIINPAISETVYVTPDGSSTVGVYDATGTVCQNYIISGGIDWDRMLSVAIEQNAVATDGENVTNYNKNNYEVIPYVVKYMVERGIGWHIDCIVVPKVRITLSYDLNLKNYVVPANTLVLPDAVVRNSEFNTSVGYIEKDTSNLEVGDTINATLDGVPYTLTFKGWSADNPNGTTSTNDPGTTINVKKDTVLYAIWEGKASAGDLKIQKTIVGTKFTENKAYSFTITPGSDVNTDDFTAWATTNGYTKTNGSITVNVTVAANKESNYVTLRNLPTGSYTVAENKTETDEFTVKWTGINASDDETTATAIVTAAQQTNANCTNDYTPKVSKAKVTKTVTGNMGDHNKVFTFNASVVNGVMKGVTFKHSNGTTGTIAGDTYKFTLKHNEWIEFDGLTIRSELVVVEEESAYKVYIDNSENPVNDRTGKKTIADDGSTIIAFRNDNQVTIDTGIELNSFPFFMMLSSCIVMAVFFFIGKKRMMF